MKTRRSILRSMALAAAALPLAIGMSGSLEAQERPELATIVVGFPPGGATDTVARLVAKQMHGSYADAVVVENRPGAAGRIAAAQIKDQPADGTWFLFTPAFPMIIHPHLYDDMSYDTLTDFTPVGTTHFGVLALSVGPAVPEEVTTVDDFIAWVKENPDQASFGAPVGGSQHFTGLMFAENAGIDLEMIGYPGGAPSVTDALGGHIPAIITPLAEVLPHAQEGSLRILAVTSQDRSGLAPDIPTFHELGYERVVVQDWSGMLAPAGTPDDVVARANAAIRAAVETQEVAEAMGDLGMEPRPLTPEEFAEEVKASWERYRDIIESTGFELEEQ